MRKGLVILGLLLVSVLLISSCKGKESVQEQVEGVEKATQEEEVFTVNHFLDNFVAHFGIFLSKNKFQKTEKYTVYKLEDVYAYDINDEKDYVYTYRDFFNFVDEEITIDSDKVLLEAEKENERLSRDFKIRYVVNELGFSEMTAIEKAYLFVYSISNNVMDSNVQKWFYFYCSPNVIVKARARGESGFGGLKPIGNVEDGLIALENDLKYYEHGINRHAYDANSRAMRNVLCPPLPEGFNDGFERLSSKGDIKK